MAYSPTKRKPRSNSVPDSHSDDHSIAVNAVTEAASPVDTVHATPPVAPSQLAEQAVAPDGRPIIFRSHREKEVNDQAAKALANDPALFQRGGYLVGVVNDESPAAGKTRRRFQPRIRPLSQANLQELLAKLIDWRKDRVSKNGERASVEAEGAHPPGHCVKALHARGTWKDVPYLEAVVAYPILLPDGSILSQPGYHAGSGILQTYAGSTLQLPERVTRDDAIAACKRLKRVFSDFPFENDVAWSGFLAAMLTPLVRSTYHGPTPLFLVEANLPGAGKGLALNCLGRIVFGKNFAVLTCPKDPDNLEKLITALVKGGQDSALFDNLSGKFGNHVWDMALTATDWQSRVLGATEILNAPLTMTFYATGNNVQLVADTHRRVQRIRLVCVEEHPENRQNFQHPDILEWIDSHRSELLTDLFIILTAYHQAGRPKMDLLAWGSYAEWSAAVRAPLVWIGLLDPALAQRELQEEGNEDAESMAMLAKIWERFDPSHKGVTVKDFFREINSPTACMSAEDAENAKDILEELCGKVDARSLGELLKRHKESPLKGRIFKIVGKAQRYAKWASGDPSAFHRQPKQTHHIHQTHIQPPHRCESSEYSESVSPTQELQREPGEEG